MIINIDKYLAQRMLGYDFIDFPVALKWTDYEDTALLLNLCRRRERILELGTHLGYTTENIARSFPNSAVHTVDIIKEIESNVKHISDFQKLEILSKEESGKMISSKNVTQFKMTTDSFFEQTKEKYDLIFIDASHSYTAVINDTNNSIDHLNNGGIIVWHDVYNLDKACPKALAEPDNDGVVHALNVLPINAYKIGRSWIAFYMSPQ